MFLALFSLTLADGPADTVSAFHDALARGDSVAVMRALADDVVIFESGYAERSAAEYASHHLGADMAFNAATTTTVEDQQVSTAGDAAWVLTWSHTTGTWHDRPVDSHGVETMVLRHTPDGWRIAHIHWSSRRGG